MEHLQREPEPVTPEKPDTKNKKDTIETPQDENVKKPKTIVDWNRMEKGEERSKVLEELLSTNDEALKAKEEEYNKKSAEYLDASMSTDSMKQRKIHKEMTKASKELEILKADKKKLEIYKKTDPERELTPEETEHWTDTKPDFNNPYTNKEEKKETKSPEPKKPRRVRPKHIAEGTHPEGSDYIPEDAQAELDALNSGNVDDDYGRKIAEDAQRDAEMESDAKNYKNEKKPTTEVKKSKKEIKREIDRLDDEWTDMAIEIDNLEESQKKESDPIERKEVDKRIAALKKSQQEKNEEINKLEAQGKEESSRTEKDDEEKLSEEERKEIQDEYVRQQEQRNKKQKKIIKKKKKDTKKIIKEMDTREIDDHTKNFYTAQLKSIDKKYEQTLKDLDKAKAKAEKTMNHKDVDNANKLDLKVKGIEAHKNELEKQLNDFENKAPEPEEPKLSNVEMLTNRIKKNKEALKQTEVKTKKGKNESRKTKYGKTIDSKEVIDELNTIERVLFDVSDARDKDSIGKPLKQKEEITPLEERRLKVEYELGANGRAYSADSSIPWTSRWRYA